MEKEIINENQKIDLKVGYTKDVIIIHITENEYLFLTQQGAEDLIDVLIEASQKMRGLNNDNEANAK